MARPNPIDNSNVGVRSNKDLSFNWLGSAEFGRLIPIHWEELIATDKIEKLHPNIEIQMLPLAGPTFGKMSVYVHYFFVPYRQMFEAYDDFRSQTGPHASWIPPYFTPFVAASNFGDYISGYTGERAIFKHWTSFGLPPFWTDQYFALNQNSNTETPISAFPFLAYQKVWWDFYRDPEVVPDSSYATYIPNPSVFAGAIQPLNPSGAPVVFQSFIPRYRSLKDYWFAELFASPGNTGPIGLDLADSSLNPTIVKPQSNISNLALGSDSNVYTAAGTSVSNGNSFIAQTDSPEIRKMEALQRIAERYTLSGKRVIDQLYSQYGVRPEWEKMKLAQYLGGAKATVLVQDITASADTTETPESTADIAKGAPLGAKAGSGYCQFSDLDIEFTASEDGILIGILSVVPHVHFVQGLSRKWRRKDYEDFYKRELAHTGLVAVAKREVGFRYESSPDAGKSYDVTKDSEAFAFTQPYYEYTYHPDILAGDFMYYHNIEIDEDLPADQRDLKYMQGMGLYVDYPTDRLFNAENLQLDDLPQYNKIFNYLGGSVWSETDDHFHIDCNIQCIINRPMDGFNIPTLETTQSPHADSQPLGTSTQL